MSRNNRLSILFGIGNRVPDAAVKQLSTARQSDSGHHAAKARDAVTAHAAVWVHDYSRLAVQRLVGRVLGRHPRAPSVKVERHPVQLARQAEFRQPDGVRRGIAAAGDDPGEPAAVQEVWLQRQLSPQRDTPGEMELRSEPEQRGHALVGLLLCMDGHAKPEVAQMARRITPIGKDPVVQRQNKRGHALDVPAPDLKDVAPLGRQVHRPPDLAKRRLADAAIKEVEALGVDDEALRPAQRQQLLYQID